jgi:hypothetical protein
MLNLKFGDTAVSAKSKQFSTGSTGYGYYGKVEIDGERYQVSCNIVKVGSKPQDGETRNASGSISGEATDE